MKNTRTKNVLITGAFGFVGQNISHSLRESKNINLVALDIYEGGAHKYDNVYLWDNISLINWDNIDVIIHLAGKAHDTKNAGNSNSYFAINYGLTKIICDKFIKSAAKVLIFFSSVKAVADTINEETLLENILPNPLTPYGQSKLEAERYILKSAIPEKKRVYILRPAMIHGIGNKGNLNLLFSLVNKGVPFPLGAFQNKRSFLSVDNMNYIVKRLVEGEVASGIYNVCDDEPLSTIEIVKMIYYSSYKTHRILNISQPIIRSLANMGDIFGLPLNSERLKKMTESYIVSNEKIKQVLSIESLPVSSRVGMLKTIRSFT